jgi:hypothetical protein
MADVRKTSYGEIVLAPGQTQTWWHTWTYIKYWRWCMFALGPVTDNSKVEITRQWWERDIWGTSKMLVTFKNIGSTSVRFRRHCVSIS